jgi:uncharacterized membrane protein
MSSSKSQPKIELEKEVIDIVFETLTWSIYFFCVVYLFMIYNDLPDIMPRHISAKGEVDGYGSKAFIWVFLVIGLLTAVSMQLIQTIPHSFNYMVKITVKNAKSQYQISVQMIRFINLFIALLWICIVLVMTGMSESDEYTPPTWTIWMLIGTMTMGIFYYVRLSLKHK